MDNPFANPFGKIGIPPLEEKKVETKIETLADALDARASALDKLMTVSFITPVITPVIEPVVEEVPVPQKSAKQLILEEHGGLESNVPINSAYWTSKG